MKPIIPSWSKLGQNKACNFIQQATTFFMEMQLLVNKLQMHCAKLMGNSYAKHSGVLNAAIIVHGVTVNQPKMTMVSVYDP